LVCFVLCFFAACVGAAIWGCWARCWFENVGFSWTDGNIYKCLKPCIAACRSYTGIKTTQETEMHRRTQEALLREAARRGDEECVAEIIRGGDARLNAPNLYDGPSSRWTALHYAAAFGHVNIVKRLVEANVLLDSKNAYGATPLIEAAAQGHKECVAVLVTAGANLTLKAQYSSICFPDPNLWQSPDNPGWKRPTNVIKPPWTALDWAKGQNHDEIADLIVYGEKRAGALSVTPNAIITHAV